MEDAHICEEITLPNNEKVSVYGVFDGHGGKEVAEFAEKNFTKMLQANAKFKSLNFEEALEETFMNLDAKLEAEEYATDTGSTSCVVLITQDHIYCANAGDSRAVLCRDGKTIPLSNDHKPDLTEEENRIKNANHFVSDQRVDGNLALSRAFGDYQYKDMKNLSPQLQAVTAQPIVQKEQRTGGEEFIINACDGIWDCKTNEECVEYIKEKLKAKNEPKDVCGVVEHLFSDILATDTESGIGTDNMTAILIKFNKGTAK